MSVHTNWGWDYIFVLDRTLLFWCNVERSAALFKSGACKVVGGRRRWRMHIGVTWTVVTSLVTLAYWRPALVIPAFASPLVTLGGHWKLFHLAPANNRAALFVVSSAQRQSGDDNNRCYRRNLSLNAGPARWVGPAHMHGERQRYYISAQSLWFHLCGGGGASRCISFLSPCGTPRERKICGGGDPLSPSGPLRISSRN